MKYVLTVTDTNSRQYHYEFTETPLNIISSCGNYELKSEKYDINNFYQSFERGKFIQINNAAVFNLNNIVAIQISELPDDAW